MFAQTTNFSDLLIVLSVAFLALVLFLIYLVYKNNITNISRRSELLNAMLKAQEGERERLAQDLHDGLGAKISALSLEAELLSEKVDFPLKEKSQYIRSLVEEVRQDVRLISRNLVPRDLERSGLLYELDKLQYNIEQTHKKSFLLHSSGMDRRLPYAAELNLFRIIQELANNTLKHAGASDISLELKRDQEQIQVRYFDNGIGFNEGMKTEGIGIINIKARVAHLHGQVSFRRTNQKGFEVLISIPTEAINYL
ncbi:MAG: sensor histidine kinase [Bacteroidia bacterium]|nr:sensor histidine kinase [Bacteroidia bacterium]